MHGDVKKVKDLHTTVEGVLVSANLLLGDILPKIRAGQYTSADLCDLGFLFRETARMSDELRKELQAKQELAGMVLAQRMTVATLNDPDADLTVRGELSVGTPNVSQQGAPPKRGTEEYFQLCRFFGFPEDAIRRGVVTFSYNGLMDVLTEMASEGKNPPPGIVKTYPKYTTVFRKRNEKEE